MQEELGQLNGYGWVDRKAGIAHIPIERAIDILATTGLPRVAAGRARRRRKRHSAGRNQLSHETCSRRPDSKQDRKP